MGVFSDRTSMDRILFAVFSHENRNQGVSAPVPLTQTFRRHRVRGGIRAKHSCLPPLPTCANIHSVGAKADFSRGEERWSTNLALIFRI